MTNLRSVRLTIIYFADEYIFQFVLNIKFLLQKRRPLQSQRQLVNHVTVIRNSYVFENYQRNSDLRCKIFLNCLCMFSHDIYSVSWCAKVYEHGSYGGWVEELGIGSNTLSHDNGASSVKVQSSCTFTGYAGIDFTGTSEIITEDTDLVSNNDQFSSYTCECACGKTFELFYLNLQL